MSALIKQPGARNLRLLFKQLHAVRALCVSSKCCADDHAQKQKSSAEHFDIIIGGGGLVGTALAVPFGKNKALSDIYRPLRTIFKATYHKISE